jgi:hypothetical protein
LSRLSPRRPADVLLRDRHYLLPGFSGGRLDSFEALFAG